MALKVIGTLALVGLCTSAILALFCAVYIRTVIFPQANLSLDDFQLGENSLMYYWDEKAQDYRELVTLQSTTSSVWVDYDEIPKDLINATVAIEDERFWTHPGVDWKRTGRAVLDMFSGKDISGGSTITQQLIKNLTKENETNVKRKVTEIVRALRFTQNNSKEDTITWYLNVIPLGSGCEGVGSAAMEYFGKPVSELSLAECASLICITNNPSRYGPYSTARIATKNGELWSTKQWNKWRQELVLEKMLKLGTITQEEHDRAVAEELVFVRSENDEKTGNIYSWYEETVISDVKRDLKEKYDMSDKRVEQLLASGGLRIYTCLNPKIQQIVEDIYTNRANLNYTSKSGQNMQSSITIIDNSTGDVVAIAGQFGQKVGNLLTNYANAGHRQPGSSLKPLSVYSPAVEMGLISPITVVDDYPYNASNGTGWPLNSGGSRYKGMTTVSTALMNSVNTIAVRIVADMVTPEKSFDFVQDRYKIDLVRSVGSGANVKSDIGIAPMSMGGLTKGVGTRDMAEAYATFPNGGTYTYSRTYTKVTDSSGKVLLDNQPKQEKVIKDTTAYYMNTMLTKVVTSGTAAGHGIKGMTAAGKTGTTSQNYDRWFVGYTPYYTAAVWTGYASNASMPSSGNPALLLWEKVMNKVHSGLSNKKFDTVEGLTSVKYCMDSGLLATEYCAMDPRGSRVATGSVFKEDVPSKRCTVHTAGNVVTICKKSPVQSSSNKEGGVYRLAGAYCPGDTQAKVCLPEFDRSKIGTAVALDEAYRKKVITANGSCTVHTNAPVQPDVEPEKPTAGGESQNTQEPVVEAPMGNEAA